jgi:fructokinase
MSLKNPAALLLGEALVDRLPSGPVAAGAALNVARHLRALGCAPLLVTRLGLNDAEAQRIEKAMHLADLSMVGVQRDSQHATGVVDVVMDANGGHRFDIADNAAWDHIDIGAAQAAAASVEPELVYFGTLAQRNPASRGAIQGVLEASQALRFLDVNLRDGVSELRALCDDSLRAAHWAKINDDELVRLGQWFQQPDAPSLLRHFGLQRLIVTRGSQGYEAWGAGGELLAQGPGLRLPRLVDTVGAGDAFSAFVLAARLHGRAFAPSLAPANAFAAALCGQSGAAPAQPDDFYPAWQAELAALPPETNR